MELTFLVVSLGSAIVILIFMAVFVVLTGRWGKKRLKEISGRFDSELDQLTSKRQELRRIDKDIASLRQKKMELIKKGDMQTARGVGNEIARMQKRKDRVHRFIEENY